MEGGRIGWAVAMCPRARTGGGKSADFTHGVFMLAFFNFGAPGGARPPSMPSPRCILSVLRSLHGALGHERGSLTCLSWSPEGAYRACNLTCAMTRLLVLTPSQNTNDKFPNNPNNPRPGHDLKLTSWLRASYQDSIQALVFGRR